MSYVTIEMSPDDRRIDVDVNYGRREIVKALPGSKWDGRRNTWTVPLSAAACLQLRQEFGGELRIGQRLHTWATEEFGWRKIAEGIQVDPLGVNLTDVPEGEGALYPYQIQGLSFLAATRRGVLADDQGLGKTRIVIDHITSSKLFPALIICPKSVIGVWQEEFAKWSPDTFVEPVIGGAAKRRKAIESGADVLIINYEAVKSHTRFEKYGANALTEKEKETGELNEIDWACVVADEAHRLRDAKSGITRAAKGVRQGADIVFALTGTPVDNKPDELWSILNFIDPYNWPAKTKYIDRYCDARPGVWGGIEVRGLSAANADEFRTLLSSTILRRTKEQALPWLPERIFETRMCELKPKTKRAYAEMADDMLARLEGGEDLQAFNPLSQLARLLQMAQGPSEIVPSPTEEDPHHFDVVTIEKSEKLDLMEDTLQDVDGQAVLWFTHRSLLSLAEERLSGHKGKVVSTIHGGIEVTERKARVAAFQDGEIDYLLLTTGAGAEGLTLTAADTAIYVQRPWSSIQYRQSLDRIYRIGAEQHDLIKVIHLVTAETVDEGVLETLNGKAASFEEIFQDRQRLKELVLNV